MSGASGHDPTREITCTTCKGSGKHPDWGKPGVGQVYCPKCFGKKKITDPHYHGGPVYK